MAGPVLNPDSSSNKRTIASNLLRKATQVQLSLPNSKAKTGIASELLHGGQRVIVLICGPVVLRVVVLMHVASRHVMTFDDFC